MRIMSLAIGFASHTTRFGPHDTGISWHVTKKTVSLLGLDSCVAGTKNRSQIHRETEEVQLKCLISGRQKYMYMLSGFSCKNGTIKCH